MSQYAVEIQDEYDVADFPTARVTEAIEYVLTRHEVEKGTGVTVVVTTDEHVRSLNAEFRGIDSPTDVLSFPADPLPDEIEGEDPYLGDLVIAYPYTLHEAQEAGHDIADELVLLVIHGTLHLLGFDHDNEEHQDAMWAEQSEALAAANVAISVPRFTFGENIDA